MNRNTQQKTTVAVKLEVDGFSSWFLDDPRSSGAQRGSGSEGEERRMVSVGRTFGIRDIYPDLGAIGPI